MTSRVFALHWLVAVCRISTQEKGKVRQVLSSAFTSAFKELDPILQFKATAKLVAFLETVPPEGTRRQGNGLGRTGHRG